MQSAIVAESEALNDCAPTLPMARTERDATTCAIAGCWHLVAGRTWCNKHYQRWQKWGDPLRTLNPPPRGAAR